MIRYYTSSFCGSNLHTQIQKRNINIPNLPCETRPSASLLRSEVDVGTEHISYYWKTHVHYLCVKGLTVTFLSITLGHLKKMF